MYPQYGWRGDSRWRAPAWMAALMLPLVPIAALIDWLKR
jgi:hypothetical protein